MDETYRQTLVRAGIAAGGGVPRLNLMTGGYTWDDDYVWDSWANFQWAGFLAGRLWLLHLMAREQGWAMLGFAHAYEASGQQNYLDAARRAADWYVENAPEGWVPHYDYSDPVRRRRPWLPNLPPGQPRRHFHERQPHSGVPPPALPGVREWPDRCRA